VRHSGKYKQYYKLADQVLCIFSWINIISFGLLGRILCFYSAGKLRGRPFALDSCLFWRWVNFLASLP
jgi:hypothetical protein